MEINFNTEFIYKTPVDFFVTMKDYLRGMLLYKNYSDK